MYSTPLDSPSVQLQLPPRGAYDLAATLDSGQAFRWTPELEGWEGVIGNRWVRLRQDGDRILAVVAQPVDTWDWLNEYLQIDVDVQSIVATFPDDEPMRRSTLACRGLRLLKQPLWECLASFILSSNKQITHIRRIVATLCARFGDPVPSLRADRNTQSFPTAARIAAACEEDLRSCGMGYRAPYLLKTAHKFVDEGLTLEELSSLDLASARARLTQLPGVGRKIADCVLLFTGAQPRAFPIDVWVSRALSQLYFPQYHKSAAELERFSETHFGPHAGYAQQYLFHYMRVAH